MASVQGIAQDKHSCANSVDVVPQPCGGDVLHWYCILIYLHGRLDTLDTTLLLELKLLALTV